MIGRLASSDHVPNITRLDSYPGWAQSKADSKVKGTTSQATRALNFTVSSAGFALSVWLCVCFEVTSVVPSTVLTNILPVRKHQFATEALGSWPNGGAWEGVICVRYMDRMSESDLNTDSLHGCCRTSSDKVGKERRVEFCLHSHCIAPT
jgi:hypothetical protein